MRRARRATITRSSPISRSGSARDARLHREPRREGLAAPSVRGLARERGRCRYRAARLRRVLGAGLFRSAAPAAAARCCFDGFRADPTSVGRSARRPDRIEIYSERIASFGYDDCPGHPVWMEPVEWLGAKPRPRYPLHLISNQPVDQAAQPVRSRRGQPRQQDRGREPIAMHPRDAAARGLRRATSCACSTIAAPASRACASRTGCAAAWWKCRPARGTTRSCPARIGTLDKHGNPERADARQRQLQARPGLHRAHAAWSKSSASQASCRRLPRSIRRASRPVMGDGAHLKAFHCAHHARNMPLKRFRMISSASVTMPR